MNDKEYSEFINDLTEKAEANPVILKDAMAKVAERPEGVEFIIQAGYPVIPMSLEYLTEDQIALALEVRPRDITLLDRDSITSEQVRGMLNGIYNIRRLYDAAEKDKEELEAIYNLATFAPVDTVDEDIAMLIAGILPTRLDLIPEDLRTDTFWESYATRFADSYTKLIPNSARRGKVADLIMAADPDLIELIPIEFRTKDHCKAAIEAGNYNVAIPDAVWEDNEFFIWHVTSQENLAALPTNAFTEANTLSLLAEYEFSFDAIGAIPDQAITANVIALVAEQKEAALCLLNLDCLEEDQIVAMVKERPIRYLSINECYRTPQATTTALAEMPALLLYVPEGQRDSDLLDNLVKTTSYPLSLMGLLPKAKRRLELDHIAAARESYYDLAVFDKSEFKEEHVNAIKKWEHAEQVLTFLGL